MRSLLMAGLALVVFAAGSAAQEASLNVLLFEKSYAGLGTPDVLGAPDYYDGTAEPGLIAEAQLAPHIALYRGLNVDEIKYGEGWGINVMLTPQIRLRAYDVESAPVKSLSFMPKFTTQLLFSRGQDPDDGLAPGPRHIFGPSLVFGHHSNGGSTCEFRDQVFDDDGGCVYAGAGEIPDPSEREVWVDGGNFSTNYVELGFGYRYGRTSDRPVEHWRWFIEGAAAFQHHHEWFPFPLPGGADEAFGALYGLDRLRFDLAGHRMLSEHFGIRGTGRLDRWDASAVRFDGAREYTLETDLFLNYVLDFQDAVAGVLGIGVRYSRGMDYYNMQYIRDIDHLQPALFLDLWTPIFDS